MAFCAKCLRMEIKNSGKQVSFLAGCCMAIPGLVLVSIIHVAVFVWCSSVSANIWIDAESMHS